MTATRSGLAWMVVLGCASVACADVLGLQAGLPESADGASGGDDADAPAAGDAAGPDAVASTTGETGSPADSSGGASPGDGGADAIGVDAQKDGSPDAGCLPSLATCQLNSDCCSNACTLNLTCL